MLKLVITLDVDSEDQANDIVRLLSFPDNTQVTLLRQGDRSGANLLLPKISGRTGDHYQGRKAMLGELRKINSKD